ncbi:bifunctional DNA primase/polymerase [Bradyrhizobium japonicum]|uniref:bifunctional DNA primase/polymerase n=1 Tax=Bradyrhizobium japonicum TaxID=375 RepID=UPI002897FC0C|nr:bifunctional DNA primase/polymerase [Bradyrhizobium japonicum]
MLHAALRYARRGCAVFPVRGDRIPHLSMEKTGRRWGASSDTETVERMFRRYPRADVAIETGAVSGFFAIDVDNKNGKNGNAALEALQHHHRGHLPHTAIVETQNGSHWYYRYPGRHVLSTTSKLGDGIDVRGDGAYVIAPPSRGRRWITSFYAIAPAPSWLIDLVCEQRRSASHRSSFGAVPRELPPAEVLAMMTESAGRGLSDDPNDVLAAENTDLKIWCALRVIPADVNYDDWTKIGFAIYAALGDSGFGHFDEWSRDAPNKYPGDRAIQDKWRECAKVKSIREDTVYWFADQYDRSWRDAYRVMLAQEFGA